ncbi:MAG: GAF domain-containing protein, partial [PVC group bacterium]|nr:GAF domain-containing protein [PVC group bacterium]
EKELILGPYAGDTTEHTRINFGQGICGLAAEKEETIIVNDVSGESNYLSCNINVKSEIVLPIFKNNRIVGEFDLDSHTASRFNKQDKEFLLKIIALIIKVF